MNLYTSQLQTQKTVYSNSLEKSIAILLLPHKELAINIEEELQNNPLLESESQELPLDNDQMNAALNLDVPYKTESSFTEEDTSQWPSSAPFKTLEDHLYQQLLLEFTDPIKIKLGQFIIGNLDAEGYLHISPEEIAETFKLIDISLVNDVLNAIQNFDPVGIATKNIKECLIVQLKNSPSAYSPLAIEIVEKFLEYLGDRRYTALSKKLKVVEEDIFKAGQLIAKLEPKPARNYQCNSPAIYIEPDLYVRKNESGEFIVVTNKNGLPALRISQTYKKLLNNPLLSMEDRNFIKDKIKHAINFMRNLEQRGETLTAIGHFILKHQKEFFNSDDLILSPMTLRDVANHLERCESTISRAISHKYMDTPQGIFPMKFFFSNNVSQQNLGHTSAQSVKQELAQLIEEENKFLPLSDQEIQVYFNTKGIPLARRTISKYRQSLDIPSSHQRKY